MSDLQAIIFDVDGTLADTERDGHRVAFNRAFGEAGLDWEWSIAQYGELLAVAGGKERIQHYLTHYCPTFQSPVDRQDWIARLHKAKTQHYQQLVRANGIPLRPGVKRLIQEARQQGVRLAIATTSAPETVIALLETTLAPDSPTWFDVIAAGDMVPAKKPAPDIYHYALQAMQLTPQQCLVIEDSLVGFKAATQAGLPTVVTVNGYTATEDFTGAALVIDHLGEPDLPFQALAGDANGISLFDVALARHLHQRHRPSIAAT